MKKFFISCDIEGVAGICVWDETMTGTVEYEYFRKQMTREVAAAARVLIAAGYEVWIKDAHATARNLLPDLLPENIRLIRNWSGHPYQMMEKLDDSFAGCAMIGYHSAAGKEGNPLAHSFSSRKVYEMRLNGKKFSELEWNTASRARKACPRSPAVTELRNRSRRRTERRDGRDSEVFRNATSSLHPRSPPKRSLTACAQRWCEASRRRKRSKVRLRWNWNSLSEKRVCGILHPGAKIDERTVRCTYSISATF